MTLEDENANERYIENLEKGSAVGLSDSNALVSWQPDKKDIEKLCDAITERFIEENPSNSADYCIYCGKEWGNAQKWFLDKGKKLPHNNDCPVLIAQDVMTGYDS